MSDTLWSSCSVKWSHGRVHVSSISTTLITKRQSIFQRQVVLETTISYDDVHSFRFSNASILFPVISTVILKSSRRKRERQGKSEKWRIVFIESEIELNPEDRAIQVNPACCQVARKRIFSESRAKWRTSTRRHKELLNFNVLLTPFSTVCVLCNCAAITNKCATKDKCA